MYITILMTKATFKSGILFSKYRNTMSEIEE